MSNQKHPQQSIGATTGCCEVPIYYRFKSGDLARDPDGCTVFICHYVSEGNYLVYDGNYKYEVHASWLEKIS